MIQSAAREGAAADTLIQRYFASRRYAGSKDRAAVRDLVWGAIRFSAERPPSGRAAMLGYVEARVPDLLSLFDGSAHAPAAPLPDEPRAIGGLVPAWLEPAFRARFGAAFDSEAEALLARAPMDLRVNSLKVDDPAAVAAALPVAAGAVPGLPFALRLAEPVALDQHPVVRDGLVEVQDAGSQHVAAFAAARPGELAIDLCAGAGGKTLALAAAMQGEGRLIACDTDRGRLSAMQPRLARAGARADIRLLDPGREQDRLADLAGQADYVLVDAPCSGTGTWRRNPELRWRLDPMRLDRLCTIQARLIDLGATLLKPGGRLVYAVCSVLDAEGAAQADAGLARLGLIDRARRRFTPGVDGCDGFFVARLDLR